VTELFEIRRLKSQAIPPLRSGWNMKRLLRKIAGASVVFLRGAMDERLIPAVLKASVHRRVPGARIPLPVALNTIESN